MEGFNAFYFSFITLCTVGYGDITPVSKVAKMLAALEAMTGVLYVAVLIARLVGINSSRRRNLRNRLASGDKSPHGLVARRTFLLLSCCCPHR